MEFRPLGSSGIMVSALCVGTMTFGKPLGEAESGRLVSHALDMGINFFDTANVYEGYDRVVGSSGGVSEELLGKALLGRRQEAVVCTKLGNPVGFGPMDGGLSARHLEEQLEKSLRHLKTDWIDLVLAHRWVAGFPVEEVWRVFDRWVCAGKVLSVGISNWPSWRVAQASEVAKMRGWTPVTASSPKFSLLSRGMELEQLGCALHYGIGLIPYQSLESGLLSGKYRFGKPAPLGSRQDEKPEWVPRVGKSVFNRLEKLRELSQEIGADLAQYVTAWTLARPGIVSLIMGFRNTQQLDAGIAGLELKIPDLHHKEIDKLFPPPRPSGGEQVLRWSMGKWVLQDREA